MKAARSAFYFMAEVFDLLQVLNLTDGIQKFSSILEETSLDYSNVHTTTLNKLLLSSKIWLCVSFFWGTGHLNEGRSVFVPYITGHEISFGTVAHSILNRASYSSTRRVSLRFPIHILFLLLRFIDFKVWLSDPWCSGTKPN